MSNFTQKKCEMLHRLSVWLSQNCETFLEIVNQLHNVLTNGKRVDPVISNSSDSCPPLKRGRKIRYKYQPNSEVDFCFYLVSNLLISKLFLFNLLYLYTKLLH